MEKILQQLIAYKSVSTDPAENARLLDFVEKSVSKHMYVKRLQSNNIPALIATTRKTKTPKLWLVAHSDIVPGPAHLFKMQKKGNKLIGRGVLDMKFAIACYIRLTQELGESLARYDFGLMISSDEEVGGFNGVQFLLNKGYMGDIAFLPDGGKDWHIETGAKGVWHLEIEAHGKAAHASRPWEGINPFISFFSFLRDVEEEFAKNSCDGKNHYHDTFTITRISGGEAFNQIPSLIKASVDVRHTPETTKKNLEMKLKMIAKKYKNISIHDNVYGHASKTDLNQADIKAFRAIACKHSIITKSTFSHGSSDARFFAERNIPALIVWPRGGGHHSDEEWVDAVHLENYYQILKEWVTSITVIK